LSPNKFSDTHR